MNCETFTYSEAVRLQARALMNAIAGPRVVRSLAHDPAVGDTLVLEGSAVMVLGIVPDPEPCMFEDRVRFRTRSVAWGIWEDEVSAAGWEALVENWLGLGAVCVPAECVEQIYPHRVDAGGITGGAEELGRFMAGFPAASRSARVSMIGGAA